MLRVTEQGYWMDAKMKAVLDTFSHNMSKDWDFVIAITGSAMLRVGKSVLAQQVGCYIAEQKKTPWTLDNIVFNGEDLINIAHKLPKNSVIIYDEARGELDSKKTLEKVSKVLQDFFAECGMYNHFIILVLPDFFELNKRFAVSRTEALINVFRHKERKVKGGIEVIEYKRGYFEFFGRRRKKELFLLGNKTGNYSAAKRDFWGEFRNHWTLDKELYEKKKIKFLQRDRFNEKEKMGSRGQKAIIQRNGMLKYLHNEMGVSQSELSRVMKGLGATFTQATIGRIVAKDVDDKDPIEGV